MQDGEESKANGKAKNTGLKANLSALFSKPRSLSISPRPGETPASSSAFESALPLPAQVGLTRVQQLQKLFTGHVSLALDSKGHPRTLIAEGFLKKIGKKNLNKKYYFILFNDLLVYAASTSKGFVLHQQVPLTDVKIIRSSKSDRLFHVQGGPKPFACITETRDERDDWVGSITSCLPDTNNQAIVFHGTLVKLQPTQGKESLKYFFLFGDGTLKWGDTEDTIRHTEMVKDVLTHDRFLEHHYGIGSKVPLEHRSRFMAVLTQKSERALCLLCPSKEPLTLIHKWWDRFPLNPIFFTSRVNQRKASAISQPLPKRLPTALPNMPAPGRAAVAGPVVKTYDILSSLMSGDFNGLVDETCVLLTQCATNDLVANLPVIACCLFETPLFLRAQAKALIECIKTRAAISGPVAQGVYGLLSSSLFEGSWGYSDWLVDLNRCGDICIAFGELTDPNLQVVGTVLEVPDELQVFHPFDGHRVRRLQIDNIFNTNAKPLLLTVHCSRDEDDAPPYRGMNESQEPSQMESFEERTQSISVSLFRRKESYADREEYPPPPPLPPLPQFLDDSFSTSLTSPDASPTHLSSNNHSVSSASFPPSSSFAITPTASSSFFPTSTNSFSSPPSTDTQRLPVRTRTPSQTMRRIGITRLGGFLTKTSDQKQTNVENVNNVDNNINNNNNIEEDHDGPIFARLKSYKSDDTEEESDNVYTHTRSRTTSHALTPTPAFPITPLSSPGSPSRRESKTPVPPPRRESKTAVPPPRRESKSPIPPPPRTLPPSSTAPSTTTATTLSAAASISTETIDIQKPTLPIANTPLSSTTVTTTSPTNTSSVLAPETSSSPIRRVSMLGGIPPARPPPRTPPNRPPPRPSISKPAQSSPTPPESELIVGIPPTPLPTTPMTPSTPPRLPSAPPPSVASAATSPTARSHPPLTKRFSQTTSTFPQSVLPPSSSPSVTASCPLAASSSSSNISPTSTKPPPQLTKRFSQTTSQFTNTPPPPMTILSTASSPSASSSNPPASPTLSSVKSPPALTKRFSQTNGRNSLSGRLVSSWTAKESTDLQNDQSTPTATVIATTEAGEGGDDLKPEVVPGTTRRPPPPPRIPKPAPEVENFLIKRAEVHPETLTPTKALLLPPISPPKSILSVEIVPVGGDSIRVAPAHSGRLGTLRPAKPATAFVVKLETAMPTLQQAQDGDVEGSPSEDDNKRTRRRTSRHRHRSSDSGSGVFHRLSRTRSGTGHHNLSVDRSTFFRDESDDGPEQSGNSRSARSEKERWVTFEAGKIIFKTGDDLRQDVACVHIFQMLNTVWKQNKVENRGLMAQARCYGVTALSPHMGCVQFVPDCKPLRNVKEMFSEGGEASRFYNKDWEHRMIASGAGGYISAYVLGIRDRHHDNILVEPNGTLFHIDFGHILGESVTIDTASFAITPELKQVMGDEYYNEFVNLCVETFAAVRQNVEIVMSFCTMMLSSFIPKHQVVQFLRNSLMLSEDLGSACHKLRGKIEAAPRSFKTRTKNVLHAVATDVNFKDFLSLGSPLGGGEFRLNSTNSTPRASFSEPVSR